MESVWIYKCNFTNIGFANFWRLKQVQLDRHRRLSSSLTKMELASWTSDLLLNMTEPTNRFVSLQIKGNKRRYEETSSATWSANMELSNITQHLSFEQLIALVQQVSLMRFIHITPLKRHLLQPWPIKCWSSMGQIISGGLPCQCWSAFSCANSTTCIISFGWYRSVASNLQ